MNVPRSPPADVIELQRRIHEASIAARRTARQAAAAFIQACQDGDVDRFAGAVDWLNDEAVGDGWLLAMRQVGSLASVSLAIQRAFQSAWIEHKHLPLEVGHRPTMARALHVLMPPGVDGEPLRLFRGTTARERQRHLYGFSWSTQREIALRFAEQARISESGAVLLETFAPAAAIHLRREKEGHYDEGEVVVDPYRIGRVRVVERLPSAR